MKRSITLTLDCDFYRGTGDRGNVMLCVDYMEKIFNIPCKETITLEVSTLPIKDYKRITILYGEQSRKKYNGGYVCGYRTSIVYFTMDELFKQFPRLRKRSKITLYCKVT